MSNPNKTLRQLINRLNDIVKDNPEALDLPLVYSIDDEGNSFHRVYFDAGLGNYNERDREFLNKEEANDKEVNCVCIN
tara:strand:- start:4531 stop:4764 length:234 start_codon:yes stop_codon:yes gene_type:complete